MEWNLLFFFNNVLLGIGLAMDAFSVSIANGLNEPDMGKRKMCKIAGVFAVFQAVMPMIGWICVHTVIQYFEMFERWIPWIALILLVFIGGKMILDTVRNDGDKPDQEKVGTAALLVQGVATSIDALSVGFTIAGYGLAMAFVSALIIAAVTFCLCMAGLTFGRKLGTKFSNKATVFGGAILMMIGLEIFIKGI